MIICCQITDTELEKERQVKVTCLQKKQKEPEIWLFFRSKINEISLI